MLVWSRCGLGIIATRGNTPALNLIAQETAIRVSTRAKMLGCLPSAFSCRNLFSSRRGRWLYITEEYAPKELNTPPTVAAKHLRPGVWRIVDWPSRRFLGRAVSTNATQTTWRITNEDGTFVFTAEGSDGALVGMLMLNWAHPFC